MPAPSCSCVSCLTVRKDLVEELLAKDLGSPIAPLDQALLGISLQCGETVEQALDRADAWPAWPDQDPVGGPAWERSDGRVLILATTLVES